MEYPWESWVCKYLRTQAFQSQANPVISVAQVRRVRRFSLEYLGRELPTQGTMLKDSLENWSWTRSWMKTCISQLMTKR